MAEKGERHQPKLIIPYYPDNKGDKGIPYIINTLNKKTVSEYSGLSFSEVMELDVFEFWGLLRDAVIYNSSLTDDGRKWLRNAWRLTQTEPDRERLREKYG